MIVQGFGNVGSNTAKLMWDKGYKIIGIGEYDGALYNPNGIDIEALLRVQGEDMGRSTALPKRRRRTRTTCWTRPCEILIPAATENVITSRNAERIRAKILCEGANGPTTTIADEILADKRVFVIPDILANAGGVTTSYFEWVQDRMGYFWTEAEVNQRLERIMIDSFDDVVQYAVTHEVNNRTGGLYAGDRSRGVYDQAARDVRVKAESRV